MSVETRLAALEASARRWRAAAVVMGLALTAVVGVGAADVAVPELVKARAFQVVDAGGRVIGSIGEKDGGGFIDLRTADPMKSPCVIHLRTTETTAVIAASQPDGPRVMMYLGKTEGGIVATGKDKTDAGLYGNSNAAAYVATGNGKGQQTRLIAPAK